MKNQNLKVKLITVTLSTMLILGGTSWGILNFLVRQGEKQLLSQFESSSLSLADAIGAQFYERYGDVQAFALSPAIRSSDRSVIVDMLNQYVALYGIYDLILVVDKKGSLVATNDKDIKGETIKSQDLYSQNFSKESWFKDALSGKFTEDKGKAYGGTHFEDTHIDPWVSKAYGEKRLGNSFTAPIKDASGEVIGFVSNRAGSRWFEAGFKEVYSSLKASGFGDAHLKLISKNGTLLFEYAPNPHAEKLQDPTYDFERILKKNYLETKLESVVMANEGRSGALFEFDDLKKLDVVTGYYPVKGWKFPDVIGWTVSISDSKEEGLAAQHQAQKIFYALFFILICGSAAFITYFATRLAKQLSSLADELKSGSTELADFAAKIAGSSAQLSSASTEQAAAIQETAASIDEVSAMTKKSADNASQSQKSSTLSRDAAERGRTEVENMNTAFEQINQSNTAIMNQVEEGNKQISEIVKVIAEIGNKTKVINDIVFQTKLLSFNASVEAARAGEHGKGFAVVAEEVGNLAQMSGNAAKEISQMLEGSIKRVEDIVKDTQSKVGKLMIENKDKIEQGSDISKRCGESLNQILGSVSEVDTMVQEIVVSSQEQAQGVSEINKAINQLDSVTHQNASVAQETSVAAQSIDHQSSRVADLVKRLNLIVYGSDTGAQANDHTFQTKSVAPLQNFRKKDNEQKEMSNVVHLKKATKMPTQTHSESNGSHGPIKIAAGQSLAPSFDDSRFEDI